MIHLQPNDTNALRDAEEFLEWTRGELQRFMRAANERDTSGGEPDHRDIGDVNALLAELCRRADSESRMRTNAIRAAEDHFGAWASVIADMQAIANTATGRIPTIATGIGTTEHATVLTDTNARDSGAVSR